MEIWTDSRSALGKSWKKREHGQGVSWSIFMWDLLKLHFCGTHKLMEIKGKKEKGGER